jgi:hypothetical protein
MLHLRYLANIIYQARNEKRYNHDKGKHSGGPGKWQNQTND